eukprot:8922341-Lingulodinium_polyedra.AAC.1
MRSNRRFAAAAAARTSHARALHARAETWSAHGPRKRAICSRSGREAPIRPHRSATFCKCCET